MDELAKYNKERWEELAKNNIEFSRPYLDLTPEKAKQVVDKEGILKESDINGKKVLCLAGGGGQQSAAFGLLNADVTVFDLSETQLERDQIAAKHYGLEIKAVQGDMRDLSCFDENEFNIVWHAHSINFVDNAITVFEQVSRIIDNKGYYKMSCSNPFYHGIDDTRKSHKKDEGYLINKPYVDGSRIEEDSPYWDVWQEDGASKQIKAPKEFRHILSTLINGMITQGFIILGTWEEIGTDETAEPGTWEHFKRFCPPYLTFWARYIPNIIKLT